jgi:hypothetical protein
VITKPRDVPYAEFQNQFWVAAGEQYARGQVLFYEFHRLGYQRRIVLRTDTGAMVVQVGGLAEGDIVKESSIIRGHGGHGIGVVVWGEVKYLG